VKLEDYEGEEKYDEEKVIQYISLRRWLLEIK